MFTAVLFLYLLFIHFRIKICLSDIITDLILLFNNAFQLDITFRRNTEKGGDVNECNTGKNM
jgi:hypothetical protein